VTKQYDNILRRKKEEEKKTVNESIHADGRTDNVLTHVLVKSWEHHHDRGAHAGTNI
jgi:hypothetical protein